MCGRFYIKEEEIKEIESLARDIRIVKLSGAEGARAELSGEICPAMECVVLTGRGGVMTAQKMRWGFPKPESSALIINARAETVREKKLFREHILRRRCVIPASHYYEWDRAKERVTFSKAHERLYLAGFYGLFQGEERFVILTVEANESVFSVHDRMPLILSEDDIENWIFEDELLGIFLQQRGPELERSQEYEQQTLPFL